MQAAAPFSQSHRYSVVIVPAIHRAGIFFIHELSQLHCNQGL
jgi:hypothetical protein